MGVASDDQSHCLWDRICRIKDSTELSKDGHHRLNRFHSVLSASLRERYRLDLRSWVERTWLALGGPACVSDPQDIDNADAFFKALAIAEEAGTLSDFEAFEEVLEKLFATTRTDLENPIQIMTIHKSKGLEFDVVLLPALARRTSNRESPLMLWQDRPNEQGQGQLILAPIKASEHESDPIYKFLNKQNSEKELNEVSRLLYVGVTRAKQHLHLLASLDQKEDGSFRPPNRSSMLYKLWESEQASFEESYEESIAPVDETLSDNAYTFKRLSLNWSTPLSEDFSIHPVQQGPANPKSLVRWSSYPAREIGTFIHRQLQLMCEEGLDKWTKDTINQMNWKPALLRLGVVPSELENSMEIIKMSLLNTIDDKSGRWILDNQHQESQCEYALTTASKHPFKKLVIDRTFIDDNNTRWIIDYKSSQPEDNNLEAFLDKEQANYHNQLKQYAEAFKSVDERAIKVGLYFPLIKEFRSWDATT